MIYLSDNEFPKKLITIHKEIIEKHLIILLLLRFSRDFLLILSRSNALILLVGWFLNKSLGTSLISIFKKKYDIKDGK